MTIRELTAFLDEGLQYPNIPSKKYPKGKTYTVPAPEALEGLRLTALAQVGTRAAVGMPVTKEDLAGLQLDDDQETDFYKRILGLDLFQEMLDDGVNWPNFQLIAQDAYLAFTMNVDTANAVLASRGNPQARANRAQRRAGQRTPKKTAGSKSSRASSGTQGRTRSQASSRSSKTPEAAEAG